MIKQLTLFCTFAIFMLAVGGVVTPVRAHISCPPEGKHSEGHPHCNVDPPPAESDPLYNVYIDGGFNDDPYVEGFLLPGEGLEWIWNGRQVGSTYAQGRDFPLDMTYFQEHFDTTGCFGPVVFMGGFFRKHKKDTANGMFWFPGTTDDLAADEVLYLLIIDGKFYGSGTETDPDLGGFPGNGKIMLMTDWELKVEGAGADVAERSCEDSGTFEAYEVPVIFEEIN